MEVMEGWDGEGWDAWESDRGMVGAGDVWEGDGGME